MEKETIPIEATNLIEKNELLNNLEEIRPGRKLYITISKSLLTKDDGSEDKQVYFFIHGAGGRGDQWRFQVQHLSEKNQGHVVVIDWLGHGNSEKPDKFEAYTSKEILEDMLHIFKKFKKRKNHIISHSYGTAISILLLNSLKTQYTEDYNTIDRVVLLGTSPVKSPSSSYLIWYLHPWILEQIRPAFAKPFQALAFHKETENSLIEYEGKNAAKNPMYMFRALVRQLEWFTKEHAEAIEKPVLIISGETDGIFPPQQNETLAKWFPNAQHIIIPKTSHLLMVEQPDIINQHIFHFLHE